MKVILKRGENESHKIDNADLEFPCRELSVRGLGFVIALSVRWQIDFSCASTRGPIQL